MPAGHDPTVRLVVVEGDSMRPALTPGDRLLVVRRGRHRYRAGDVVALADPRDPRRTILKRVAAVTGRHVTVLGDNAAASTDSRTFGPVDATAIHGRAVYRYAPIHRAARVRHGAAGYRRGVDLDQVLADDYVGDVTTLAMETLREKRSACQQLEVGLSYLRRLAQGRLDIVAAELRRRTEGGAPLDHDHLVEGLSDILGDHILAPGTGRLPQLLGPDLNEIDTESLDEIAGPGRLSALGELADSDLAELIDGLSAYESDVSAKRRRLHERIDELQAEITRRYKTGEASVESLLQ